MEKVGKMMFVYNNWNIKTVGGESGSESVEMVWTRIDRMDG